MIEELAVALISIGAQVARDVQSVAGECNVGWADAAKPTGEREAKRRSSALFGLFGQPARTARAAERSGNAAGRGRCAAPAGSVVG